MYNGLLTAGYSKASKKQQLEPGEVVLSGNTVYWGEGLSEHFNKPVDLSFRAGFWSDFEILVMGGGGAAPYNQAEGTSFETKGTNYFYKEAELCEKGSEYAAFECKSIE